MISLTILLQYIFHCGILLKKRFFYQKLFLVIFLLLFFASPVILISSQVAFAATGTGLDRPCNSNVVFDDGTNTNTPGHVFCIQVLHADSNGDAVYNSYALQSSGQNSSGDWDWSAGHFETYNRVLPFQLDSDSLTSYNKCNLSGSQDDGINWSIHSSDNKDGMIDQNGIHCYDASKNNGNRVIHPQYDTGRMGQLNCAGLNVLMHDAAKLQNDGRTERLVYCGMELKNMCLLDANLRAEGLFYNYSRALVQRADPFDSYGINAIQLTCMGNKATSSSPGNIDLPTYSWCNAHYHIASQSDPSQNYCDFSFNSNPNTGNQPGPAQNGPGDIIFGSIKNPIASTDFTSIQGIVKLVTSITFAFIATVAGGVIFYAGFTWMTAQGEPEKIKKAQSMILYAFVGIAVIAFSVIIIRLTAVVLGFDLYKFI